MPLTPDEAKQLAAVIDNRINESLAFQIGEAEARIREQITGDYRTILQNELEALAQDFNERIQVLGQNDQAIYAHISETINPAVMAAWAHEFWTRSVLAEAARIRAEVEAQTAWETSAGLEPADPGSVDPGPAQAEWEQPESPPDLPADLPEAIDQGEGQPLIDPLVMDDGEESEFSRMFRHELSTVQSEVDGACSLCGGNPRTSRCPQCGTDPVVGDSAGPIIPVD